MCLCFARNRTWTSCTRQIVDTGQAARSNGGQVLEWIVYYQTFQRNYFNHSVDRRPFFSFYNHAKAGAQNNQGVCFPLSLCVTTPPVQYDSWRPLKGACVSLTGGLYFPFPLLLHRQLNVYCTQTHSNSLIVRLRINCAPTLTRGHVLLRSIRKQTVPNILPMYLSGANINNYIVMRTRIARDWLHDVNCSDAPTIIPSSIIQAKQTREHKFLYCNGYTLHLENFSPMIILILSLSLGKFCPWTVSAQNPTIINFG